MFRDDGCIKIEKPSYEELVQRIRELEKTESERKHIEEDLLDNEAKFRLLAENMNDILWTADLCMNINYLSPSIEKVLGFTVEERLKQSLQEQMPPETLQLTAERLAEELEFDGVRNPERYSCLEIDYYHKDGSLRCLDTSLTFIRNKHGKPFEKKTQPIIINTIYWRYLNQILQACSLHFLKSSLIQ